MSQDNLLKKVKELRELTGVGFKDCKSAIDETKGDIEKSIILLRKKGIAKISKRMSRVAAEGLIYISEKDNNISLIEINSETDFVARNKDFINFGYTAHHPRGAYALKKRQKGKITTLVDVIWNVGKSGVVAPVAILKPVEIDDARISRATLHNMAYIEALGLEIGCKVEVIRSGELAEAMESRGYGISKNPTSLYSLKLVNFDIIVISITMISFISVILLGY